LYRTGNCCFYHSGNNLNKNGDKKLKWIDRKFDFDFPVSRYPEFIQKLKDTIPHLHFLVHSTRLDFLKIKVDEKWSIQEIIGHLNSTDQLLAGRLEDYLEEKEELRPADLSGNRTNQENYNDSEIRYILKQFDEQRSAFLQKLETLDAQIFERTALHPRLQIPMRLCDMLYFYTEHDQHHLNRISELLEQFEANDEL
jgi:uncharacterized damage-inducible protein DinB